MAPTDEQRTGRHAAAAKPQRRFQFIDNSNIGQGGANSTQVRRHVMQEYMREKRWENRSKAEDSVLEHNFPIEQPDEKRPARRRAVPRAGPSTRPRSLHANRNLTELAPSLSLTPPSMCTTTNSTGYVSQESFRQNVPPLKRSLYEQARSNHVQCVEENCQTDVERNTNDPRSAIQRLPNPCRQSTKSRNQDLYLTPSSFAQIADLWPTAPLTPPYSLKSGSPCSSTSSSLLSQTDETAAEPTTLLSAARTDPFDCLPLTLERQDQELFDFYAQVMPACSYGFERRSPRAHNWYLSVFIPEAMKSPVAFQNTILVHAANTQAWVKGLAETPLAIEHRARASAMLSDHFQKHPFDTSDAAISAVLSAAALEDFDPRLERREYAWLHWRAAMDKIRDRGGPDALEQNLSLQMLINWSDYIFSGYNGHGPSFYFSHESSPRPASASQAVMIGQAEIAQQCEDFIVFLKCTEQLALVAATMQNSSLVRQDQRLRYSVFQPDQPLYKLLASSNAPRYTKTGSLKQIISRLAALMTINTAVWEYRYSTTISEAFFDELLQSIRYNDLDQHISVEALLQILLSGSRNPSLLHTERPWLVGRLLKVAKRLSRPSWERLNNFLLRCLTLGPSLSPVMHAWEHELRAEILAAPLVSHVLPLMQQIPPR